MLIFVTINFKLIYYFDNSLPVLNTKKLINPKNEFFL